MARAIGVLALAGLAAACGAKEGAEIAGPHRAGSAQAERAYWPPPTLVTASRIAGGRLVLTGRANPASRVRVATPTGQAVFARPDARGQWRIVIPGAAEVRLFGLSMSQGDRTIQSQGYLTVTPEGDVAQLRAGAGAMEFLGAGHGLRIASIDFDGQGGAVVSGIATPGASVRLAVDGAPRGVAAVDPGGRFTLALNEPLTPGDHRVDATLANERAGAVVAMSPAAPLAGGPFRAERIPTGWRIDWITPGGGLQTTLIITARTP